MQNTWIKKSHEWVSFPSSKAICSVTLGPRFPPCFSAQRWSALSLGKMIHETFLVWSAPHWAVGQRGFIPLWCPGMRHCRSSGFIPYLRRPLSLCERDFVLRCLHCCSPFLDGLLSLHGLLRLNKRALFLCQNSPSWRFLKSQAAAFVKR